MLRIAHVRAPVAAAIKAGHVTRALRGLSSTASPLFTTTPSQSVEKDTIVKLLYNIGSRDEVEEYLNLFSSVDSPKFAVIKVGGQVITDELDTLTSSLTFLHRVGLYPIVLHGAGPQLNIQLEQAGVEPNFIDGIRVTDGRTMGIARRVFYSENTKLVNALERVGVRARPLIGGHFTASYLDREKYGLVGQITQVNTDMIEACINAGALPILTCMAETEEGQILNVNADIAAGEIAKKLQPLKVVYLNSTGGLMHGETGQKIDVINLDEEYDRLMAQPWVKYGTKLKIKEINALLQHLPRTASVSITAAADLSRELFTHKGAGTLLRRGNRVVCHQSLDGVDKQRLHAVFQHGVDTFPEASTLLESLSSGGRSFRLFTDDDYEGAAVVIEEAGQVPRLALFACRPEAVLSNMRANLWEHIRRHYNAFCWVTSRRTDGNQAWFFERSDGSFSSGDRTVFWCGLGNMDDVQNVVNRHLAVGGSTGKTTTAGTAKVGPAGARSYSTSAAPSGDKTRVAIVGARGYVGQELMKMIRKHPQLELVAVGSRELAGQAVPNFPGVHYTNIAAGNVDPHSADCWVMALPNGYAAPYVSKLRKDAAALKRKQLIIDLSADYRFDSAWTYGLVERNRTAIRQASLISNPGCYATGAQLGLLPLVNSIGLSASPSVFGVSGYSGAGTTPSKKNDPAYLADNIVPYSLVDHMHEREVSHQLRTPIHFMPHVGQYFQGISLTINAPLSKTVTVPELLELYRSTYADEPLVRVVDDIPVVKDNAGRHHVTIGGFSVLKNRVVFVVTLDNLLKGAATQALQNINLAFGHKELEGIDIDAQMLATPPTAAK